MSLIERIHDAVSDQRSDPTFPEFVAKGFRVVAKVGGEAPQVAGVASGDLRADLGVVFLRGGRVDVGDVQRFDIHKCGDFQRSNAVVRAGGVVVAGLIAVEASRIDCSVTGAFLGGGAQKRTLRLGWNPCEPRAEDGVVRKSR